MALIENHPRLPISLDDPFRRIDGGEAPSPDAIAAIGEIGRVRCSLTAMRSFAHFISIVLIAPQGLLFAAIRLLRRVTDTHSLLGLFLNALDVLSLMLGWGGGVVLLAIIFLIALGCSARWRSFAAACVLVANVCSAASIVFWMSSSPIGDIAFVISPAIASAVISIWLIRYRNADPARYASVAANPPIASVSRPA